MVRTHDRRRPAVSAGPVVRAAPLLVVASIGGIQFGQAWAKTLFDEITPLAAVALRLGFAALVMLVVFRPTLPTGRHGWLMVIGLGLAISGMNVFIYPALSLLPVGIAVTLQFLGPFAVALAGSRRWLDAIWAILACAGVALFIVPDGSDVPFSWTGAALALLSGTAWAFYILVNKHAGNQTGTPATLALAVACAAVISAPIGIVMDGPAIAGSTHVLLTGLGVAVASAVIPYLLDWTALRRISARLFGILGSLEPAVGAAAAAILLRERLSWSHVVAIGCVVTASACASATDGDPRTARRSKAVRRRRWSEPHPDCHQRDGRGCRTLARISRQIGTPGVVVSRGRSRRHGCGPCEETRTRAGRTLPR